jgi:hypothetical protein
MSENLEPIKQVIQIDVNENGTSEATEKVQGLNKSINNTVVENKKSEDSFKSLKVQLREAIVEQQKLADKFGATSQQAIKAAKAVAGIKDEIGLQKDLVDSFNPDDKFRALTQTAGVAALALGGVKDGFTALGIESEVLDKVIGSAQAILGVTSAVAGMSDAYAVLTASKRAKSAADVVEIGTTEALAVANTEATVTTWSWNAALLANPIVLITAGIVAAGAAIYAYVKITGDAVKAEEKAKVASMQLDQAIEHQSKTFEKNSDSNSRNNDFKIALLKASGASEAQIYKETKALKEQDRQLALNFERQAERLEDKAFKELRYQKNNGTKESIEIAEASYKLAEENLEKAREQRRDAGNKLVDLQNNHEIAITQAETYARIKREELAQKARDDKKAKKKSRIAKDEAENKRILDEQTKNELDLKKATIDAINAATEKNNEFRISAQQKEIQDVNDKYFTLIESAKKFKLDTEELLVAQLNEQNEINLKYQNIDFDNKKIADQKATADKKTADEKAKADQKVIDDGVLLQKQKNKDDILATGEALITGAKMLAGKNKSLQKAAIIAEGAVSLGKVGVNIATGISKDAASGAVASVPQIIKTIATGAVSTASIISNTARALKALGGGGGGVGGESPLPTRNVAQVGFQASSENQIGNAVANQQRQQPPLQAFVVSQSVRDAEELARKKELVNSF